MTRQYRNKYVISPGNEGTSDASNVEIIHVIQCNSSSDDLPFDVERQANECAQDEDGDASSTMPRQSQPQAPTTDTENGHPDPPGTEYPTTVTVPDRKKRLSRSESRILKDPSTPFFDLNAGDTFEKEKDIQLFAHTKKFTILAILCAWVGFTLSVLARNSTRFVTIKIPMYFDPNYNTVTTIGMVNLELCYNSTFIPGYEGCIIDKLGSEEVSDVKYQLARSFSSLVVCLGGFAAVMITSSIFWYSINLRPLGICFLMSYFLESFSFILLDSEVCKHHGCSIDTGGYLGIVASGFWMLASVSASRMDAFKFQQAARKKRRHLRMLRRKARLEQMKQESNITEATNISLTDSDSWENSYNDNASDDSRSEPEVFNRTLVSSFPASSTDAVETTFVNVRDDIEQGKPNPPEEVEKDMPKHKTERPPRNSKRRVQLVEDDDQIERRRHRRSQTLSKINSRIEMNDHVPGSPETGSARTIERFRVKLVRHQTT